MDTIQAHQAWRSASPLDADDFPTTGGPGRPPSPGEPEEPVMPDDSEGPPGEHKHEPIDDPDPADTTMQRQPATVAEPALRQ